MSVIGIVLKVEPRKKKKNMIHVEPSLEWAGFHPKILLSQMEAALCRSCNERTLGCGMGQSNDCVCYHPIINMAVEHLMSYDSCLNGG